MIKMNETDLQTHVVKYIRMQYPKARFCASLGGIRTSISQAKKAKKTGYWAGFPDLQKQWIKALNERGYKAVICKGFIECKEEIDKYLK